MRELSKFTGLLLLFVWVPGFAGAQDMSSEETIVISEHQRSKIRLALEDFQSESGAGRGDVQQIQGVVMQDLDYSGWFRVVRVARITDETSMSGFEAVVRGRLSITSRELSLEGTLESHPGGEVVFRKMYRSTPDRYRDVAHRFADDIVLFLTGQAGIARTKIAFVMQEGRSKEVYVVDYDGHGLRKITENGSINLSPAWHPGGSKLAFVSYKDGDPDIFVADLATGAQYAVVSGPGVQSAPAWSPVGGLLAYSQTNRGQSSIYVCDERGNSKQRVTKGAGIDTSPGWSPDGRRIVFTSDRPGTPQLYITEADGGVSRRLTFTGKWNDQACWSPDGARIVFSSREKGLYQIHEVDPAGLRAYKQLTYGPGSDESPRWAPDGRHLVFCSTRNGSRGLYILDTDDGVIRSLVSGRGDCFLPDWSNPPAS